ncbi:prenyltransferase [Paenibacillus campi]|uniref:prenyltransferase n=1 Tax=Paenibacillus campi TaxID=3106031 RepID=UPI002AFF90EE|nr:prenyltransferase [Paenibacillus sp. SGZ-1014]
MSHYILQALTLRNALRLVRPIAVLCSSVAIIFSGVFPLVTYGNVPVSTIVLISVVLLVGCILIHGMLTHALNDYIDHLSATDQRSPAMLSGGSRIIQEGRITPGLLYRFGLWLTGILLVLDVILLLTGQYRLAILLLVGIWGAASYSLPALRLSYYPLAGEWISTFPSALFLGLGGAWLATGEFPLWSVQNALINALYCIAWVMVHHIPDLDADRQASPVKRTSVVWCADRWGVEFSRLPALAYMLLIALCSLWLAISGRYIAAASIGIIVLLSIWWIWQMDVHNPASVTACEKKLLLLAIAGAVLLGIGV